MQDKITVTVMEENNDVFLAGIDALVYLADSVQKNIFYSISLGPLEPALVGTCARFG